MPGFDTRRLRPERLDDPALPKAHVIGALRGLRRVHRVSGGIRHIWPILEGLTRADASKPLRVLDVATGGGDVPLAIARKARRAGLRIKARGCDISPHAVEYASNRAQKARLPVKFFCHDVKRNALPSGYDVIMSSLFLHHLGEDDAVRFLRNAREAAERAVIIDDLRRSAAGYWFTRIGLRLLTLNSICHSDGPQSVEGAFTLDEARQMAANAGWTDFEIRTRPPFRYLLTWMRP